jgi:hypothetical protein
MAKPESKPTRNPRSVLAERLRTAEKEAARPDLPPRDDEQQRMGLRRLVRIFYDLQRLRLQSSGRVYERGTEIHLHPLDVVMLAKRALELIDAEQSALKDVQGMLRAIPFYQDVLSDKIRYRGVGPAMAGVLLSEFDFAAEDTVSKAWAFAGLRPMPAFRCKACHSVVDHDPGSPHSPESFHHRKERTRKPPKPGEQPEEPKLPKCPKAGEDLSRSDVYESGEAQHPTKGEKLPYNSWLRTKLIGVLGPVLLQCASPWRRCYDDYKHRKQSAGWGRSDAHRHQAAIRYMVKMLILDVHTKWREYHKLPVRAPYQEEKLGHKHEGDIMDGAAVVDPEVQAELETVDIDLEEAV